MVWPHRLMRITMKSGCDICKVDVVFGDAQSDTKRLVHSVNKLNVFKAKNDTNMSREHRKMLCSGKKAG